jgi:hypothetical protein
MNETQRERNPEPERRPTRRETELDREPASNRGHKGQMRESRRVARSAGEGIQPMAGHDDSGKGDQTEK